MQSATEPTSEPEVRSAMTERSWSACHPMALKSMWEHVVLWSVGLELLTIALRFGMHLDSTRDTASTIGRLTYGIRIHHSYCGAVLILCAWGFSEMHPRLARAGMILGWALVFSDLVHHFLVLWPITGSPHFALQY